MKSGEIWNIQFPLRSRENSEPYGHGPVVIISADWANLSALRTVLVAVITTNLKRAKAPGNVYLEASEFNGLREDSVINVSQVLLIDKSRFEDCRGRLTETELQMLEVGLKQMLSLS